MILVSMFERFYVGDKRKTALEEPVMRIHSDYDAQEFARVAQ